MTHRIVQQMYPKVMTRVDIMSFAELYHDPLLDRDPQFENHWHIE